MRRLVDRRIVEAFAAALSVLPPRVRERAMEMDLLAGADPLFAGLYPVQNFADIVHPGPRRRIHFHHIRVTVGGLPAPRGSSSSRSPTPRPERRI